MTNLNSARRKRMQVRWAMGNHAALQAARRNAAEVTAEVEAKNAAIEAGRIAMIEQLKIRNWLQGQATLQAWIKALEGQGASKEEIDKLKASASTKGFGVAIANAQGLSQAVAAQNAKEKYTNLSAAEEEMGRVVPVAPYAPLGYVDEEEKQWLEEGEGQRAWEAVRGQSALPALVCTPTVFDKPKPWWIPSFSVQEAVQLVRTIPSVEVASNRNPVPVAKIFAPGKMISFGTVTAWNFGSNANPGAELRTDGFGAGTINESDKPSAFAMVNFDTAEISSSIRFPVGLGFTQDGFSSSLGYSLNAYAHWDGWNTTVSIDLNYADVATSGAGMKGNISKGVYVEVKPLQVALATTILVLTVAAALSGYPITKEQLCPAFGC